MELYNLQLLFVGFVFMLLTYGFFAFGEQKWNILDFSFRPKFLFLLYLVLTIILIYIHSK